jgi:hypothetical protein
MFQIVQTGSASHAASSSMGLFPRRVKRPGRDVEHSPPSTTEAQKEWRYNFTTPIRLHGVERDKSAFLYFDVNLSVCKILHRCILGTSFLKTIFDNKGILTIVRKIYQFLKRLHFYLTFVHNSCHCVCKARLGPARGGIFNHRSAAMQDLINNEKKKSQTFP